MEMSPEDQRRIDELQNVIDLCNEDIGKWEEKRNAAQKAGDWDEYDKWEQQIQLEHNNIQRAQDKIDEIEGKY